VERGRPDALAVQLVHLVFHEGDERRDDERQARQDHGGELITERLSGARRHDGENVPAGEHRAHELFLSRPEGRVPEEPGEIVKEIGGHWSNRRYARSRSRRGKQGLRTGLQSTQERVGNVLRGIVV
jgi:hypothetical protein